MARTADAGRRRVVRPRIPVRARLREILGYRELLVNLVRKELKVKYKNSVLGFLWSMLNPLLYLVIFSIVLGIFLRFGLPWYAFYLLSGLLAWNLLATGLQGATASIVGNASLVSKVYFPREILPLSAVGASLVHFVLQLVVLAVAMALFRYPRFWDAGIALLPVSLAIEILLVVGLALLLSSLNVLFRDVQHLLELGLLAWFWFTPIVYASAWVQEQVGRNAALWALYLLNPMTPIVLGFQRALYAQRSVDADGGAVDVLVDAPLSWYFERLGYVAVLALVFIVAGWTLFRRLEGRLAEEL